MDSVSISNPMTDFAFSNFDPIANIPVPHPKSIIVLFSISFRFFAFHSMSLAIIDGVVYCSSFTLGCGCGGICSNFISRCFFFFMMILYLHYLFFINFF